MDLWMSILDTLTLVRNQRGDNRDFQLPQNLGDNHFDAISNHIQAYASRRVNHELAPCSSSSSVSLLLAVLSDLKTKAWVRNLFSDSIDALQ